MVYSAPVAFRHMWTKRKARLEFRCVHCNKIIPKGKIRIALKRNSIFCFHFTCFEKEYKSVKSNSII